MNYVVSENGKYFYKVGKDGKKARVSKEEYEKKTKPRKSKKGGGGLPEGLSYAIIIGAGGNLSPEIQKQLADAGLSKHENIENEDIDGKYIVFGSKDYDLTGEGGIEELASKINSIMVKMGKKGAVIFASAERDPKMFENCKSKEKYDEYLKTLESSSPIISLDDKRKHLMNLNVYAPITVFDKIKHIKNAFFVYISTIYIFEGTVGYPIRKEVITEERPSFSLFGQTEKMDFVPTIEKQDIEKIPELFEKYGANLYAYGKRYVELELNNTVNNNSDSNAKVIILRMDGITPEIPAPGKTLNYKDGTFLLTLYNPKGSSFNPFEVRYPVFPSQISKVIIAALYKQTDKIKVYHIAGTEKKGITKAEIIINFVNDDFIKQQLIPNFKEIIKRIPITPVKNREMDDSNSKLVAGEDYNKDANYATFMDKLKAVYNKCTPKKEVPVAKSTKFLL